MYVHKLKSNVKGEIDLVLSPRTLIIGPPASHKSAIRSALELALTGESSDLGKAPATLMQFAPPGIDLLIEAAFRDEQKNTGKVEFRVVGTTAKAQKPKWDIEGLSKPPGVIMGSLVSAVLAREPKRQREAILRVAAPRDLLSSAKEEVGKAFADEWDSRVAQARIEADREIEGVASDADVLVTLAEMLRAELKTTRAVVKAGTDNSAAPPVLLTEEYETLKFTATDLETRLKAALRIQAIKSRIASIDVELKKAADHVESSSLPAADKVRAAKARLQATALLQNFYLETKFTGPCLVTGLALDMRGDIEDDDQARILCLAERAKVEAAVKTRIERERQIAATEAKINAALAAKPGRAVDELEGERAELIAEGKKLAAGLGGNKHDVDAPATVCNRCLMEVSYAETCAAITVPFLSDRLTSAKEAITTEDVARVARKAWEDGQLRATKAVRDVDVLGALSKAADRVVATSLQTGIVDFAARASLALPDGWKLGVQLFDGKKAVCRVGLERNSVLTPWQTLSGQERAITLGAFASAWAISETVASTRLLMVDDVWLDGDGLTNLCTGLGNVVGTEGGLDQAIVFAVTDYGIKAPSGWNVVRVTR